jgi:hypothetical protein
MHTTTLQDPQAVAQRLLVLAAVSGVAFGLDRAEIVAWLENESLWPAVSPEEAGFLKSLDAPPKDSIAFSWQVEAVHILGWALRLRENLEPPTAEVSVGDILEQIPGPGDSVAEFVESCVLRPAAEIQATADEYFDIHARCRASQLQEQPERHGHNIEVVQERHRALNWLIRYEDAEWDHVATDT